MSQAGVDLITVDRVQGVALFVVAHPMILPETTRQVASYCEAPPAPPLTTPTTAARKGIPRLMVSLEFRLHPVTSASKVVEHKDTTGSS